MLRYKDVSLGQLRIFCEFLRRRSFSDAARALGISHAAVWQQVRALERRFRVKLLERQGRYWRPTTDGDTLLDLISGILHDVEGLEDRFRQLREDAPRALTIIASPAAALGELAEPLRELRHLRPKCRVRILVSTGMEQATEQLLAGTADLALLPRSIAEQLPPRRSLKHYVLAARPAAIAAPHGHALARKRRLSLEDLTTVPLLLPSPDFGWRRRVDEVFRHANLLDRIEIAVEVSLTQALQRYVHEGLGVAVYPRAAEGVAYPDVVVRSVEHLFPPEEVICVRPSGLPRPEVQMLEQLLNAPSQQRRGD